MDIQAMREEASKGQTNPNLMTTPEIDREIENWRLTGIPPFPELRQCSPAVWHRFSRTDLRLIHHIAGLSIELHRRGLSTTTIWASKIPWLVPVSFPPPLTFCYMMLTISCSFLAIAVSSDFVMSAIMAFSASHLAYITGNKETESLAFHHRGIAFKGLQSAMAGFSKENSDAILAASILLSWQVTDWPTLTSLQRSMFSVRFSLRPSPRQLSLTRW